MKLRELKCWPDEFHSIGLGLKRHEIRVEDGVPFQVNETILLRQWKPRRNHAPWLSQKVGRCTGLVQRVRVSYITRGPEWGIPAGLVVLSIFPIKSGEPNL